MNTPTAWPSRAVLDTVRSHWSLYVLAFCAAIFTARGAQAETLTFAWNQNPEPDVIGYYIYIAEGSGSFNTMDVGNATSYTFTDALPGKTYRVTVAAYVVGPVVGPAAAELVYSVPSGTPTLVNPGNRTNTVGDTVTLALSASDPNGDTLAFDATGLPTGLSIDRATGVISGRPTAAGRFLVAVTATDPSGNFAGQSFTWTIVANDTAAPSIAIVTPTTASLFTTSDAFATITGTASDDTGVTSVTWVNSTGGSGTTAGTTAWSVVVQLKPGTNVITLTAHDAAGHASSASLTADYQVPATLTVNSLTASVPAPQNVGTTITFTALASGGTGPYAYQWRVFDGSAWTTAQGWSGSNVFSWSPRKANSKYQVQVWARSAGQTADAPGSASATQTMAFPIDGRRRSKRR